MTHEEEKEEGEEAQAEEAGLLMVTRRGLFGSLAALVAAPFVPEQPRPLVPPGTATTASDGTTYVLTIDGKELASVVVPHLPDVISRYGLV